MNIKAIRKLWLLALAAVVGLGALGCGPKLDPKIMDGLPGGTYAHVITNQGEFVFKLFTQMAPKTCENFIALAEGTKPFTDPFSKKEVTRSYYDGLIFHTTGYQTWLVTGDPTTIGNGGPGFWIDDEYSPQLRHDRPGVVSMVKLKGDEKVNGGQFAVFCKPQPLYDDIFTVFGQVVRGMDKVTELSCLPVHRESRPVRELRIKHIEIVKIPGEETPGMLPVEGMEPLTSDQDAASTATAEPAE